MKKVLFLLAVAAIFFSACKKDSDTDLNHQKICDTGYEGDKCEIEKRDKFIDEYTVIRYEPDSAYYNAKAIKANSNILNFLFINVLNNSDTIICEVDQVEGHKYTIPTQIIQSKNLYGSGWWQDSELKVFINYDGIQYKASLFRK